MSAANKSQPISTALSESSSRTIVIGGPKTGKTTAAQKSEWTAITNPHEAEDALSDEHVIIDDFYVQFERCFGDRTTLEPSIQKAFESLCRRESGICFTIRPRELDWLLLNRDQASDLLNLADTKVQQLAYEKEEALRVCEKLDAGGQNTTAHLDHLQYEYSFESTINNIEYYETYIPYLLLEIADRDLSEGLVPETIQKGVSAVGTSADWYSLGESYSETISELWEKIPGGVSSLVESAEHAAGSELARIGAGSAMTAIAPPAAFIALPLVCQTLFAEDPEKEAKGVFGQILSRDLLPHAQVELENELGLPPRTIDTLHHLTSPAVLESLETNITANQERMDAVETTVERFQSQIAEFKKVNNALKGRVISLEQITSERFRKAIRRPEQAFTQDYIARRQLLEQRAGLSTEVAANKTEQIVETYREAFTPTASTVVESTDKNSFTAVVEGSHGHETWACLEEIASQYRSAGYTVGVVDTPDAEFLKPRLRALTREEKPVALLYRYESSISPEEIRQTFEREVGGIFDALIISCTPSAYYSLRRAWENQPDVTGSILRSDLEPDITVQIDGFDDSDLTSIINLVGVSEKAIVRKIIDSAEGRPFVAFHNAAMALNDGTELHFEFSGTRSIYPPIEESIKNLEEHAPSSVNVQHLIDALAAVGYVRGDSYDDSLTTLANLAGIEHTGEAVEFAREYMTGLIQQDGTGCRLSPAALGIVWNEDRWFRGEFEQRSRVFDDIVERIRSADKQYLSAFVTNLRTIVSQQELEEWDQPDGFSDALAELLKLTGETEELHGAQLLYRAVHHKLQLPPDTLLSLGERNTTEEARRQYSRAVSRYAALYLVHGKNSEYEQLIEFASRLYTYSDPETPQAADKVWVYGYAFYQITDILPIGDGVEYVEQIDTDLKNAVADSKRAGTYRIHAYAVGILPHLHLGADADEYSDWVIKFENWAHTNTEFDPIKSVIELYTALIGTKSKNNPSAIEDWLRFVETRIDEAGSRQAIEENKPSHRMHARTYFIEEYYSTLLASLLEQLSDEQIEQWCDSIGRRAAIRFQEISDEEYGQHGNYAAYSVRPFCLLYGGTVRRFDGDIDCLLDLLPKLAESAERIVDSKLSENSEQICTICGQLIGNYLVNAGPEEIGRAADLVFDVVEPLDTQDVPNWPGLNFEPAAIVEAGSEVAAYASLDKIDHLFSAIWNEYRNRAIRQDSQTVPGCRAANSFSVIHTFYGLVILRAAWYKHPKQVADSLWTQIEQDVTSSNTHLYRTPTGDSQLVNKAGELSVLRAYAIAYRMITSTFLPNEQNIAWLEHLEWRLYERNSDDALAVVIADVIIQQFEEPKRRYYGEWVKMLRGRINNLSLDSVGRGYLLILDGLPLENLSMEDCLMLAKWLGASDTVDAIDAFGVSVDSQELVPKSLNSILSEYNINKATAGLRDQIRAASTRR